MIERLPSQSRKAFNYEAQIAKIEEEIERYQKLKLGLYENFIGGIIDKSEYFEFRSSYTKIIEDKQEALLRVKKRNEADGDNRHDRTKLGSAFQAV